VTYSSLALYNTTPRYDLIAIWQYLVPCEPAVLLLGRWRRVELLYARENMTMVTFGEFNPKYACVTNISMYIPYITNMPPLYITYISLIHRHKSMAL
jgi:hypothetical protein